MQVAMVSSGTDPFSKSEPKQMQTESILVKTMDTQTHYMVSEYTVNDDD